MSDRWTDGQTLKDRATQFLIKNKSGALVTQYTNMRFMTPWLKGVVGKNTNANVSGASVQGGRG